MNADDSLTDIASINNKYNYEIPNNIKTFWTTSSKTTFTKSSLDINKSKNTSRLKRNSICKREPLNRKRTNNINKIIKKANKITLH